MALYKISKEIYAVFSNRNMISNYCAKLYPNNVFSTAFRMENAFSVVAASA